jgi:hypothetical protein
VNWLLDITKFCKDFFIPCAENNFRPKSLENRSFFVFVVIIIAIKLLGVVSYFEYLGADIYNQIAKVDIYSLTNQIRQENGIGILNTKPQLELSAQLKLNDMIQSNYFAHESPSGYNPWHWFDKAKYNYLIAGENLAMNFISSKEVINAWLNSETHKKNLLYKDFTDIGVAVATGKINNQETIVVVQHFAKPVIVTPTRVSTIKSIPIKTPSIKASTPKPSVMVSPIVPAQTKIDPISLKAIASKVKGATTLPSKATIANSAYYVNLTLRYLLIIIGVVTVLLLVLKVFVAIRVQYPVLILRSVVLILLCWSLIYFKDYEFLIGDIMIGTGDANIMVIK